MPSNTTDPNSPESLDAALLDAARVIALAINTSDPEPLINKLGARVTFESQSVFEILTGREEVANYLRNKMASVKDSGVLANAEVGRINNMNIVEPGVIIRQAGVIRTFWRPRLDEEGNISSIFGYTGVPLPSTARGLGETPGLDEDDFERAESKRIDRHREWVQGLTGPIQFVAFILSSKTEQEWKTRLGKLAKRYPGSSFRVSVHDHNSPDPARRTAALTEGRQYEIFGYPAIAVVKDGHVIREARGSTNLDRVIAELEEMGEPPILGEDWDKD